MAAGGSCRCAAARRAAMRYMLMIYRDEKEWEGMSVQERGAVYQAAVDYCEALRPSGFYQGGDPLEPPRTGAPRAAALSRGGAPAGADAPRHDRADEGR